MTDNFGHDAHILALEKAVLPVEITDGADAVMRDGQRRAAVLMLLVKRAYGGKAAWHVLLTQRPETMPSHAGQIAFPGGKHEMGETILQTALRETHEEIGVERKHIKIFGRLPSFNAVSSYRVTPFIGVLSPQAKIIPDNHEVADVFEVPLEFLMNPDNHISRTVHFDERKHDLTDMPYTGADGVYRNIWGMTAMIIFRLYQRSVLGVFDTQY